MILQLYQSHTSIILILSSVKMSVLLRLSLFLGSLGLLRSQMCRPAEVFWVKIIPL